MFYIYYSIEYQSPVGLLTIASSDDFVVGLWIAGQKYFAGTLSENMIPTKQHPLLEQAEDWLDRYFAGEKPSPLELPLAPIGGEFRQKVWKILCEIPYGQVITYGEIAKGIAEEMGIKSMSAQAVGGAVGHNPISIIIPCHRVIGTNGSLTGYAAGVEIKQKLLAFEGVQMHVTNTCCK